MLFIVFRLVRKRLGVKQALGSSRSAVVRLAALGLIEFEQFHKCYLFGYLHKSPSDRQAFKLPVRSRKVIDNMIDTDMPVLFPSVYRRLDT